MKHVFNGFAWAICVVAFVYFMVGKHEKKPPPPPPRAYFQHYPAIGDTFIEVTSSGWRMMWVGRDSIFHSCVMDPDSLLKLVRQF